MPGSATLDSDILLDDLVGLADELRGDLHTDFGVRAYRVYTVTEVFESGTVGDGPSTITEVEFDPQPLVKTRDLVGALDSLQPCGLDEAGVIELQQVSLSYTKTEITGRPVVDGVEQDRPEGTRFFIRIREAHGQEQNYRDFKISKSPVPDRIKTIGWKVSLVKIEDTI